MKRQRRMEWWREARFGLFVHWGLYSLLGRHEWAMNLEKIPVRDYEKLADAWHPRPRAARAWARLAKQAGMQYMVLTTKHHEGFCLWDTAQTDYNAVQRGPGRDLVREHIEACREYGLKVGLYYSLMDWHHPDGLRCAKNEAARRRFVDFTQGCVRELCSNYGPIDILWYDVPCPLETPEAWESARLNAMARELQPHLLINNRSRLPEDFGTPEGRVEAEPAGRDWEACMTFNGSWGYMPGAVDWHSTRKVLDMVRVATAGGGNLLLNIGPKPDGAVPREALRPLRETGRWLALNGEAVYGRADRSMERMQGMPAMGFPGWFTLKGRTAYAWIFNWVGEELVIGGIRTPLRKASFLATGQPIRFEQESRRVRLLDLPPENPDRIAGVSVIQLDFAARPRQSTGTFPAA